MTSEPRVRYAVVGLGYIAQAAVLPAFVHAKENSELAALVSDDPQKLQSAWRALWHAYQGFFLQGIRQSAL